MLTFLRKIRKSLIESGSTRKYLLYAIGEILLVMIGILLALQVNNWNEWRKDRLLEIDYLENVKKELSFNIQLGIEQIEFSDFQAKNGKLILTNIQGDIDSDPMDLAIALEHVGWNHEIIFIKDVWNELYATGNIGIVRNEEIKRRLTDLYNVMTLVNKFQEHEWSSYNFGVRRLIADILVPSVRLHIDEDLEPGLEPGPQGNPLVFPTITDIPGLVHISPIVTLTVGPRM